MNHEAMSTILVLRVSGTNQFGNEFFLNRMIFQRKQAHPRRAIGKGKKAISESTVNSQRIAITLKLEAV